MSKTCGYIALLGRPNAGKSTLLNALVGDKVAVVSRKPQTTRNRILGVAMEGEAQILFLDTPGIHRGRRNLINATMNKLAMATATEADLLLYLVDASAGVTDEDRTYLTRILQANKAPCLVLLTKIDALKKAEADKANVSLRSALADLFSVHPELKERVIAESPMPVSAKRPESVAALKRFAAKGLPEGPWLFPEDDLTDMPRNFIAGELIREQLFRQLGQEIPYGCAVKLETMEFKTGANPTVVISALIVLTRDSHKPIVLGKGGSRIKALGVAARESLEKHFGQKVFLDLSVRVSEGWIDDQRLIADLAHLTQLEESAPDFS